MGTKRTGRAWIALLLASACSASSNSVGPDAGASSSGSGSGSSASASGGSGSTPPGIQGLFLDGITSMGSVVYDAQGGLHVVGYGSAGLTYGECSSQCGLDANWAYANVPMTTSMQDVGGDKASLDLAVDGQGHPRVMASGTLPNSKRYFEYAECNAHCGSASNWTATDMSLPPDPGLPASTAPLPLGDQFFAVAPQGVAAFAYFDALRGIVYSSCTSGCTTVGNWQETVVMAPPSTGISGDTVSLAFDAAGNPHLAFTFVGGTKTWYAACGGNCTSSSGWAAIPADSQAMLLVRRLAVDGQGRPTILSASQYYWCDANCATDSSGWHGPVAMPDNPLWAAVDAQNNLRAAAPAPAPPASPPSVGHYLACTADCNSASPTWNDTPLPYSYLDGADTTEQKGDQWGSFESSRTTISLDTAGNAAITTDATRWYMYNQVTGDTSPDGFGVFLWLIPAIADSGGTSSSGSSSGSGLGDAGSSGVSNFEGATWTGTLTATLSCGDAGTATSTSSETVTFVPTATGFSYTDKNGCTLDFTVSGSTATLSNAPVTCSVSTDAGSSEVQYTSATLTSADGHNLTVDTQGNVNSGSLSCSIAESGSLSR